MLANSPWAKQAGNYWTACYQLRHATTGLARCNAWSWLSAMARQSQFPAVAANAARRIAVNRTRNAAPVIEIHTRRKRNGTR